MSNKRKGIILAGGLGSRLWPITMGVSKQLLPVFDKPMIYYPLSVLMLSGIQEIAIITTPNDQELFKKVLGDGSQWGIALEYIVQHKPEGLAQAYVLAENFLSGSPSVLLLGDNIFFGHGLPELLKDSGDSLNGGTVFAYKVADPERYGVVGFDERGSVRSIEEKPFKPQSNYAVTGLYQLDSDAPSIAKSVKPSCRGELEIADVLNVYMQNDCLSVELLGRGYAWFDTGTHESLLEAGSFVRTLQKRQGVLVGSPDEIAYNNGWISDDDLQRRVDIFEKSDYGLALKYLDRKLETVNRPV